MQLEKKEDKTTVTEKSIFVIEELREEVAVLLRFRSLSLSFGKRLSQEKDWGRQVLFWTTLCQGFLTTYLFLSIKKGLQR